MSIFQGKLMYRITFVIILLFSATAIDAASYKKNDGTIVDPIQLVTGGDLPYSGDNLEPSANLWFADLTDADLTSANLTDAKLNYANLRNANLTDANLFSADLTDADLRNAILNGTDLTGALMWGMDLSGADLSGSDFTNVAYYNDATWTDAFYYTDNEPTWDSGMDAAWRSSAGILALAPTSSVPEPSTLLLALFGLALLPRKRRR